MTTAPTSALERTVAYLSSDSAERALAADAYWPKWHSPWWHMLLLNEMGETALIPERIVARYVEALNRIPVKFFPLRIEEFPPGVDPQRGAPCHCQLGNVYRVLAARGVDVDAELPWIKSWFFRYQMADGGFNCDEAAYLVEHECPSSMVGTIAIFEAVLAQPTWTADARAFLDRGAAFLMGRELRLGSATAHNADERESAKEWGRLCFPRFYFYDVLRGLAALTTWAGRTGTTLPQAATRVVVDALGREFAEGRARIGRQAIEGRRTRIQDDSGVWGRGDATMFPLLAEVSQVGAESPYLTRQWQACREALA